MNRRLLPRVARTMMAQTDTPTQANSSSFRGVLDVKSFASTTKTEQKRKSKGKQRSKSSKGVCSTPDLDIVSGFAFLSFPNLDDLECHIEQNEVNTLSLSINVGEKRKIQRVNRPKTDTVGVGSVSKRIKKPSQKILESYATSDFSITKSRPGESAKSKRPGKVKPFPEKTVRHTHLLDSSSSSVENEVLEGCRSGLYNLEFGSKKTNPITAAEISLVCSERLDVCLFEEEEKLSNTTGNQEGGTVDVGDNPKKKSKKRKRKKDKNINDQTCQTMFRIKKKIKPTNSVRSCATSSKTLIQDMDSGLTAITTQKSSQTEGNDIVKIGSDTPQTEANINDESNDEVSLLKSNELKAPRSKISNKVEKIDYCARSGGFGLVEKHHERQKHHLNSPSSTASCGQQFPCHSENDSKESCYLNTPNDDLSDISGNDTSSTTGSVCELEGVPATKSRCFASSSSVFISSLDDTNDATEIDVDTEEQSPSLAVNIVKALPKSYLFGHLSSYPDKTTKGTIDVSIQTYDNDIQLYMNYASEFKGEIIKIIVPDDEDSKTCIPRSASMSGLPKFLQPQEYVKAVRSATERNRRHTIVDLFHRLKNELFDNVREFYFSKQAILSKALETLEQTNQENCSLTVQKNRVCRENQKLRKKLNILLFGKELSDGKQVDIGKVTEYMKTLDIEIKIPSEPSVKKSNADQQDEKGTQISNDPCSNAEGNVTRKGRPPLEKTLLRNFLTPKTETVTKLPEPQQLSRDVRDAFHNTMKGFVAIAPSDTSSDSSNSLSVDQNKNVITDDSSGQTKETVANEDTVPAQVYPKKIVCNLSRYGLHQQPGDVRPMTIVTNPEPLKAIESKNVVHIKISNDTMRQVSSSSTKHSVLLDTNKRDEKIDLNPINTEIQAQLLHTVASTQGKVNQTVTKPLTNLITNTECKDINSNTCSPGQQSSTTNLLPSTSLKNSSVVPLQEKACLELKSSETHQNNSSLITSEAVDKNTETSAAVSNVKICAVPTSDIHVGNISARKTEDATSRIPKTIPLTTQASTATQLAAQVATATQNQNVGDIEGSTTIPTYMMASPQCSSKAVETTVQSSTHGSASSSHVVLIPSASVISSQKILPMVKPAIPPAVAQSTPTPHFLVTAPVPMTTHGRPVAQMIQAPTTKVTTLPQFPVCCSPTVRSSAPRYVTVVGGKNQNPQHAVDRKTFFIHNSSISSPASPYRIIFKPTGEPKIINSPLTQVKGAIQSSFSLMGNNTIARTATPTTQKTAIIAAPVKNTPASQAVGSLSTEMQIMGKHVLHHVVSGPSRSTTCRKPNQHVLIKPPPMQLVRVQPPQILQSKLLPRIQPSIAVATPILPLIGNTPEKPTEVLKIQAKQTTSACGSPSVAGNVSLTGLPVLQSAANSNTSSMLMNLLPSNGNKLIVPVQPMASLTSPLSNLVQVSLSGQSARKYISPAQQGNEKQTDGRFLDISQKTTGSLVGAPSVGSKETFTEIEKILAKIPSPNMKKTRNVHLSCQQTVGYERPKAQTLAENTPTTATNTTAPQTVISYSNKQPINTPRLQNVIDAKVTTQSQNINNNVIATQTVSNRDTRPASQNAFSNSQETPTQRLSSIAYSNNCISTGSTSFDSSEPKADKTCSVVDSPEIIGNVVTADTLSVSNFDSSIPDITSELQDNHPNSSKAKESLTSTSLVTSWETIKLTLDTKESSTMDNAEFNVQDESTAEDFDLLNSLE